MSTHDLAMIIALSTTAREVVPDRSAMGQVCSSAGCAE